MLRIAICDDNIPICGQLETMLDDIQQSLGERLEVESFFRAEELEDAYQEGKVYDLVFLDIEMPGQSGLELARKIREVWCDYVVQIAYITANRQYMSEMFDTQPVDFLPKPLAYEQVLRAVQVTQRIKPEREAYFEYTSDREIQRILCREMVCLQVQGKFITITLLDGTAVTYRGNLSQAMAQLEPHGFIRINQSEAVNERYVLGYSREHVRLRGDKRLAISQRRQKDVLRQLRGEKI